MATLDYTKCPSDERIRVDIAPSGSATGVAVVAAPTADELNNAAGSGFQPASQSISWNDFDFGMQASEVSNEPSLADAASSEEFGQSNFGGGMSFYYPADYDDNSNQHSVIYDLTAEPGALLDVSTRLDGDLTVDVPYSDGDFVSIYEVRGDSEANPFTPGESKRRTVGFNQAGSFAYNTVVGDHAITVVEPDEYVPGAPVRLRALQEGRDTTNRLSFVSSDAEVLNAYPGGFIEPLTPGAATVLVEDPETGDSTEVSITVTDGS